MVSSKASPDSEAEELRSTELLTAMGHDDEQLLNAGVMLVEKGLHPEEAERGSGNLPWEFVRTRIPEIGAYRQRIRLRADCFEDSEIWSETDEGVISVTWMSRDHQPGLREARSPGLPYPALDSRRSAMF